MFSVNCWNRSTLKSPTCLNDFLKYSACQERGRLRGLGMSWPIIYLKKGLSDTDITDEEQNVKCGLVASV